MHFPQIHLPDGTDAWIEPEGVHHMDRHGDSGTYYRFASQEELHCILDALKAGRHPEGDQ